MSTIKKTYPITTLHAVSKNLDVAETVAEVKQITVIGKLSDSKARKVAEQQNLVYLNKTEELITSELSLEKFHELAAPVIELEQQENAEQ